jgi:hypothetical protein
MRTKHLPWKSCIASFLTLGAGLQLRYGYRAGVDDQWVLSPRGMQSVNQDLFENDYFVANAPQPHIAFDLITGFGERIGLLGGVYFLYWLIALFVLSLAISLIVFVVSSKENVSVSILATVILVLGPVAFLGTTTPALARAIPHVMGGSLALLVIGLLLVERARLAGWIAILAAIMHVQNGLLAGVILFVWLFISWINTRKIDFVVLAQTLSSFAIVGIILTLRPVAGNSNDFLTVCRDLIPYHCDANTWSVDRLVTGAAGLTLVFLLAFLSFGIKAGSATRKFFKTLMLGIVATNIFVVLADRLDVPFFGELFQQTNAYRIGVLTVSLAAISLALHIGLMAKVSKPVFYTAVVAGTIYLIAPSDAAYLSNMKASVLALAIFLLISKHAIDRKQINDTYFSVPVSKKYIVPFAGTMAAFLALTAISGPSFALSAPVLSFDSALRGVGERIQASVPVGETITMDPKRDWVRLSTRRAVVVDCKYVPYGGEALAEYLTRLEPLGGFGPACGLRGFEKLTAKELSDYAGRFDSHYLLLTNKDYRLSGLEQLGWEELDRFPYSSTRFVVLTNKKE